jgi:hypothetical protein
MSAFHYLDTYRLFSYRQLQVLTGTPIGGPRNVKRQPRSIPTPNLGSVIPKHPTFTALLYVSRATLPLES